MWAEHASGRLRMYAAGDSEMQFLDGFLRQDLAPRGVGVREDARISTGLTKPFFFDWQAQARGQARSFEPDVSVVFMGANDGSPRRARTVRSSAGPIPGAPDTHGSPHR